MSELPRRTQALGRQLTGQISDLLLPRACALCWASGQAMLGQGALCRVCDRLLRYSSVQVSLASLPLTDLPVATAGSYSFELAGAIGAYKNAGRRDLEPYFLSALCRAFDLLLTRTAASSLAGQPLYLVPIPSSRASIRRRGFAPAQLLAAGLARNLGSQGWEARVLPALRQRPAYRTYLQGGGALLGAQKTLGLEGRRLAVAQKMELASPAWSLGLASWNLEGRACLLLDDVATSGASMEAARILLEGQGARVLGGLALARVPKRQSGTGG